MTDTSVIPLQGVRILSLALNLPGPAALMRCRELGAQCTKIEPPVGDAMRHYNRQAYDDMHVGVKVLQADLKTEAGSQQLHALLEQTDVLLTSFRPSALEKLGIAWDALHTRHPSLCQVAIVGAAGSAAEEPGHDLTYMSAHGLVPGLELPPTLYADMGGALLAVQGVLQAALRQRGGGEGIYIEVALADAAGWLGKPRAWGLTSPGASIGGGHAGYRVYPCKDGRVAVAALEPHFAKALCEAAGLAESDLRAMHKPETHKGVATFFAGKTRAQLDALAVGKDIPLHTMPP